VSNPEFPSSYQPDPRWVGVPGGAPEGRRESSGGRRSAGRGYPGRGRAARSEDPGLTGRGGFTGRGDSGSGGHQAAAPDGGRPGRLAGLGGLAGLAGLAGRVGPSRSRRDQGGASHGREARGEARFWGSPARQDTSGPRGRQQAQGTLGPRGTSASRERYAAARERYAARVGAARAGRGGRPAEATGVTYRGSNGTGRGGTGYNGNGYSGTGYEGVGYKGNGYDGTGYRGSGYGGRRSGGYPGRGAPGRRRLRGRHGNGGDGGDGSGFSGDGRERRKGDWWRHWTLKKVATVLAISAGCFVILAAAGGWLAYAKTTVPTERLLSSTQAATTVYFSDNRTRIGQFGTIDRQTLTYNQIPPVLRNAVVAAEDKNFWHEGGVSPTGIVRAAFNDLTNSGGNLQGGSTITQQLVRNYYANVGTSQTLTRKIKEIFVAQKLAQTTGKEQILKEYLNTVYFGDSAYGVGAAAQAYFGLSTSQLSRITPAQAAMIAAMIQSPSYYSPNPKDGVRHQALVARWHYVLNAMADMGTLPQQTAAKATFPQTVKPFTNNWSGYRGYVMQAVLNELRTTYGYSKNEIFNGGLHVVTTVNAHLMSSLYATVRQNRTLMRNGTPPAPPFGARVASTGLPKYVHIGAVLEQPGTGAILAMYGGQNYNKTQFDNALQSRNQVGSSFKPYVLATAVKQGMNVQTSHLNGFSPLWIPPDSQPDTFASIKDPGIVSDYQVQNDEVSNPDRPVSVVEATAMSLNTAYADLWHRVAFSDGQHNVVDMAKAFGVNAWASGLRKMQDQAGTALGQASLTVEEQANMMATLAAGGEYAKPHVIKRIIHGNQVTQAKVDRHQVLTPDEAAEVDYAMSFDMGSIGTANGLGLTNGQTVIAKTGTTNLSQSAFFLGATPRYAMAVGMFVSKPNCPARVGALCTSTQALAFAPPAGVQTLFGVGGLAGYGGQWPAIIWHDYFTKEFNDVPVQAWPPLPANFGTSWNLVGHLPKPKHTPEPRPSFSPPCQGNGRRCQPSPGPTLPINCQPPLPCPSGQPTVPPGGGAGGAATVGGMAAGGMVATGVMVALLPAGIRRWRPWRRRRGPDGKRTT
jgi:membrane peptidoglycan carboxypeptidase